jgi:hypothetical protein
LKVFISIPNSSTIISTKVEKKFSETFTEKKKMKKSAQKEPTTLLRTPSEDRSPKHKLIELPNHSSNPLNPPGETARSVALEGAKRGEQSLTLWMAGLQHIIALVSGGFIRRIKPGVSYRRDPLRRR